MAAVGHQSNEETLRVTNEIQSAANAMNARVTNAANEWFLPETFCLFLAVISKLV